MLGVVIAMCHGVVFRWDVILDCVVKVYATNRELTARLDGARQVLLSTCPAAITGDIRGDLSELARSKVFST